MQDVSTCIVCEGKQSKVIFRRDVLYPKGDLDCNLLDRNFVRNHMLFNEILKERNPVEFVFKQCTNCGFIWFTPRPDEHDMSIKYRRTMELGDVKMRWRAMVEALKPDDDKRALHIAKRISQHKKIENLKIADIGGAEGHNLRYFIKNNTCCIIDFEKWDSISNVRYLCKTVEDIPDEMRFDVVLYCHILEHVVNPMKELDTIKKKLNKNGIIYIEVPFGCWREYRNTHNFLTHINFFSTGILWKMFNVLDLKVRYLKLQPALTRFGYSNVIVAIIENAPSVVKSFNGYEQTLKEMRSSHLILRLRKNILNFKLHPIGYLKKVFTKLSKHYY